MRFSTAILPLVIIGLERDLSENHRIRFLGADWSAINSDYWLDYCKNIQNFDCKILKIDTI